MAFWVFKLFNWKVCVLIMVGFVLFPLLFIPPSTWNEAFWRYWHETPIIEWAGQLAWIFFAGALASIAYVFTQEVFFG